MILMILLLAALLRAAHLFQLASSPFFERPVLDGAFFDRWALDILAGAASAAPFYQDPLYAYILAFSYGLFGHHFLPVYLIQTILGLGTVALVAALAGRLFGSPAGVATGLLAAAYKPFIFYESQIEKTSVAVALVALWLWLSVRVLEGRGRAAAFSAGVVLGLACLTRGNLLVFILLLPGFFLLATGRVPGKETGRSGRTLGFLALAGGLAVLVPVAIRNSVLGGELLLTTTQIGQNFYAGNNPANRNGQNGTPPWVRTAPEFEEGDFAAYAEQSAGRPLTRREVSAFYAREAVQWALDNPRDALGLLARKAALFLSRVEVPDNQDLGFFGRYSAVLRAPLPGFGLVFGLGFAGMAVLSRGGAGRLGLLSFFWIYAVATVSFFVLSRYRVLALPALLPFAGAFVAWFAETAVTAVRGRGVRRAANGLALAALGFAITMAPAAGVPPATAGAQTLANLGARYYQEGDPAAAERSFREALAFDPGHLGALRSLGVLAFTRGDRRAAYPLLLQAAGVAPEDPITRYYLGLIHEAGGDLDAAEADYTLAARLLPGRADVREALARIRNRPPALPGR